MTSSTTDWSEPALYSELSERQQEVLRFLWNCPSPHPPSFREIGRAVDLKGPSGLPLPDLRAGAQRVGTTTPEASAGARGMTARWAAPSPPRVAGN